MAKYRSVTPVGDTELRHGYTATAVHQLSKLAANTAKSWLAMDYTDILETAWFAIVELLYTSEEPPARHDLVRAGQRAVNRMVQWEMHHAGYNKYKSGGDSGPCSSPQFAKFWFNPAPQSPEDPIVERTAVEQILPLLSPGQQDALHALAACDDYMLAAESLGMTYVAFRSQVSKARRRFLQWWHEGEEPSKPWGCDRRVYIHHRQGDAA